MILNFGVAGAFLCRTNCRKMVGAKENFGFDNDNCIIFAA